MSYLRYSVANWNITAFKIVAEYAIDVSTIARTIAKLKAIGISKFAIINTGDYISINADALLNSNIYFMTQTNSYFNLYKRIVKRAS